MDEKLYEDVKTLNNNDATESGDVLDSIIHSVGDMGRYQRWMVVAFLPFVLFLSFFYYVQMFIAATPQQHWCRVPELQHLDIELRRNLSIPGAIFGEWDRCAVYDANWTEVLATMSPPENATTTPCRHGWEFIFEDIPYPTIISERDWVCENSGKAPFAQSVFFVGAFLGCALFGWMGDRYGRLPALMGANLIGCLGSVATIFTSGVWDFAASRFVVGLANDSCYSMFYILLLEYVGRQHRTWVSNMTIGLYFALGALAVVGLALWLLDWRLLMWATALPPLTVLATPWLLPESVRWLTSTGKVDKAVETLRKFERINKRKIPDELMAEFVLVSKQKSEVDESFKAVLSSPPLSLNCLIILITVSTVGGLALDAILRMSESIGSNFFLTFALSSISEIPALAVVTLVLDKWGRRSMIVGTLIGAGALSLWCAFTIRGLLQTILAVAIRFFLNMTVAVQMLATAELIPTGARASCSALVHLTVFIAIGFSPYVVYSGRFWTPLPLLIVGVICVAAGALSLLLPETKGKPMPQTIVEAEKLIRDGMFWRRPVSKKGIDADYVKVDTEMR